MPIPLDELFAIRFQLQDYTLDEFIIIKRLKIILLNDNMNLEEVNSYLVDFYNNFGAHCWSSSSAVASFFLCMASFFLI